MKYVRFIILFLLASIPLAVFAQEDSTKFVPLTNVPFLEAAGNASTLPKFLNDLYRICIGLAAVIAVLQIMRAGVMYMGGDSVTEKKEAKNLIGLAIGGLILVLSPVVVFSIINPDILSLKINGIQDLVASAPAESLLWTDSSSTHKAAAIKCSTSGGNLTFTCKSAAGASRTLAAGKECSAGEESLATCTRQSSSEATQDSAASCKDFGPPTAGSVSGSCQATVDPDYVKVADVCCVGMAAGNQCCARPNNVTPTTSGTDITKSIVALKYAYRPVTGASEDLGPVSGSKSSYDAYVSACTAKEGTAKNAYGAYSACSASDKAAITDARKDYIQCVSTTVSCTIP